MLYIDTGKLIKSYRKKRQMTQVTLAKLLDCCHTFISKIENGIIQPSPELCNKIATILDIQELLNLHTSSQGISIQLTSWNHAIANGNLTEAEQIFLEMKQLAPVTTHINDKVVYDLSRFQLFVLQHNLKEAANMLPNILGLSEALDQKLNYRCHKLLGLYYIYSYHFANGLNYLDLVMKNHPNQARLDPEINLYFAIAFSQLHELKKSTEHAQTALKLFEADANYRNIILCRMVICNNEVEADDHSLAIKKLNNLLDQSSQQINAHYHATILYLLAKAYTGLHEHNKAIAFLKDAIRLESADSLKVIYTYYMAYIYAKLKRDQEALVYIKIGQKLEINQKYQYKLFTLESMILNKFHHESSENKIKEELLPYFELRGDHPEIANCHKMLAGISYENRSYKKSYDHLKSAVKDFQLAEICEMYKIRDD